MIGDKYRNQQNQITLLTVIPITRARKCVEKNYNRSCWIDIKIVSPAMYCLGLEIEEKKEHV